jgi:hypothetical protein
MGNCEEDVMIACGIYFRAREEKKEFHTLFGRLKDDRQQFFSSILE